MPHFLIKCKVSEKVDELQGGQVDKLGIHPNKIVCSIFYQDRIDLLENWHVRRTYQYEF